MFITYSKSMDQPGKVANPARGQLNRENEYFPVRVRAWEFGVSRDRFSSPVPRQPAHLHTQAEYGAYIRDSSRFPQRCPLLYLNRPDAIELVPSLSDHAITHRWCSLPRVRRNRASKPLSIVSFERVLPFCRSPCTVRMRQLRQSQKEKQRWLKTLVILSRRLHGEVTWRGYMASARKGFPHHQINYPVSQSYIYQTPLVHDSPATRTRSSIENLVPQTAPLLGTICYLRNSSWIVR